LVTWRSVIIDHETRTTLPPRAARARVIDKGAPGQKNAGVMTPTPWNRYAAALPSIADAVGRTPLVKLNRVARDVTPAIYVKVEWYGATGSLKDRIYLHMFERAEQRGDLGPGMRVLECSTGNAGIACAWVSAVKGYACTIVMPEGMSDERKKIMRAYGAELVFTPGGESDVDLSLQKLEQIRAAAPAQYWVPGQFDNPDNVETHMLTTGPEIWEQSGGRIDAFVDSQGSGGLLTGVGRYLRTQDPRVRLYAVEPAECALLSKRAWGHHGIEGIGDGFVPRNLDVSILTGIITTTTEESVEIARRLAREEGIFCGISSGCNVAAALKLARRHPDLGTIVTPINDTGQRYFTTPLCGEAKHVDIPEREHPLDAHTVEQLDRYQARWEIVA
jgi:cysteine synthase A